MEFLSPLRAKAPSGVELWKDSDTPLPWISLRPRELRGGEVDIDLWQITVVYNKRGQYMIISLPEMFITKFLSDWRNDPEQALKTYFQLDPPRETTEPPPLQSSKTDAKNVELDF